MIMKLPLTNFKKPSLKKLLPLAVVTLLLIVGIVYAANKINHKNAEQKVKKDRIEAVLKRTREASTSKTPSADTLVATNQVSLMNFSFYPRNITVTKGTTVTWTNQDPASHDVTGLGNLSDLKSPTLKQKDIYSYTFNSPGTYNYHSNISSGMAGTVVVKP
jgi:plastocyanin